MALEFIGSLIVIEPVKHLNNGEQTITFVVQESGNHQYPQKGVFECYGKSKVDFILKSFVLGDLMQVFFNLNCNEYTNKEGEQKNIPKNAVWQVKSL